MTNENDIFNRSWIVEHAIPIVRSYNGNITLRALHYRLVAAGMFNTLRHYKRVVSAMTQARWDGLIGFGDFVDHERESLGNTDADFTDLDFEIDYGQRQVSAWMNHYKRNRWENQEIYPEVWIEKKALIGVFEDVCHRNRVSLNPCKGYPSLTFLEEARERFEQAQSRGQEVVMLYFGDYDPSGEDIPRSIKDTLARMGCYIEVKRIALMEEQVIEWKLPPAPTKDTDTRSVAWDGLGQVELDAVEPNQLKELCQNAIDDLFDTDLHEELLEQEAEERITYVAKLKEYVQSL